MRVSFQHVNPQLGNESTLLHIEPEDQSASSYLIDAGDSVSPQAFLDSTQSLEGLFLTHAHSDHYERLTSILSTAKDVPLYTSPATANVLDQVYREATQYRDLGDVEEITAALTPIETWTRLSDYVDVCPVPAGHTPGAVGFLFRIDDLDRNNETVIVFATGDFTTHPVAGYPGLEIPDELHVDVMIANAATSDDFAETFSTALGTILEQALGGARTLVATSGLAGIHAAYALGHTLELLNRDVPITVVGQAAKLYTALEYDVPFVRSYPQFEHTDEVLGSGEITIAGPSAPTQGSTRRLYGVIEDDPSAAFVQLNPSDEEVVDGARCGTFAFPLAPHPSREQLLETIDDHLPRHLILKHVSADRAKSLGDSFADFFHWANDDTHEHTLYDDGTWTAPDWITESQARRIKQRTYQASGPRMPLDQSRDEWPTAPLDRRVPDLDCEGVAVSDLKAQFAASDPTLQDSDDTESIESGTADSTPTSSTLETDADEQQTAPTTPNAAADVEEKFETVETKLDELGDSVAAEQTVVDGLETVTTSLDQLEETVTELPAEIERSEAPEIQGTIVRQDDFIVIRVDTDSLDEVDEPLEHGQEVELTLRL